MTTSSSSSLPVCSMQLVREKEIVNLENVNCDHSIHLLTQPVAYGEDGEDSS